MRSDKSDFSVSFTNLPAEYDVFLDESPLEDWALSRSILLVCRLHCEANVCACVRTLR